MTSFFTDWSLRTEPSLEVYLLGLVDFDAALFLQERLLHEISQRDDGSGALLICEHPPLVTIGREGSRTQIACEPEELVSRRMDVRWLNRGGPSLVHAPGQLAAYPIVPLMRRGLGLVAFRDRLESAVIDTCGELRVPAWRHPEHAGVWCRCGKLASFGAAVRSGVSYHGMFVNVCPNLQLMRLVRSPAAAIADEPQTTCLPDAAHKPCGPGWDSDLRVTSLAAQRVKPTAVHTVRESLIRRIADRLCYGRHHVYTGHPLLKRTRRIVAYA